VLLSSIGGLSETELHGIEWAISEITDNVLTHSESPLGGIMQVTTYERQQKRVEFAVCDTGVGIPHTLRQAYSDIRSDTDALTRSIREGVTRDRDRFQGNGLFGSFRVACLSKGYFQLHSGLGEIWSNENVGLGTQSEGIPFNGTLVMACIDCSVPDVLRDALMFEGEPHTPIGFIETHYESEVAGHLDFHMNDETPSLSSREAGHAVRLKLSNLLLMSPQAQVHVDMAGIEVVSSSFADEAFGKLFASMGPITFGRRVQFDNVGDVTKLIIDKAIRQRGVSRPDD